MKAWEVLQNLVSKIFPKAAVTKGSGNVHHDADVRTPKFAIECKSRSKPNFILTKKVVNKLKKEAFSRGLIPVWVLENDEQERVAIILLKDVKRVFRMNDEEK